MAACLLRVGEVHSSHQTQTGLPCVPQTPTLPTSRISTQHQQTAVYPAVPAPGRTHGGDHPASCPPHTHTPAGQAVSSESQVRQRGAERCHLSPRPQSLTSHLDLPCTSWNHLLTHAGAGNSGIPLRTDPVLVGRACINSVTAWLSCHGGSCGSALAVVILARAPVSVHTGICP